MPQGHRHQRPTEEGGSGRVPLPLFRRTHAFPHLRGHSKQQPRCLQQVLFHNQAWRKLRLRRARGGGRARAGWLHAYVCTMQRVSSRLKRNDTSDRLDNSSQRHVAQADLRTRRKALPARAQHRGNSRGSRSPLPRSRRAVERQHPRKHLQDESGSLVKCSHAWPPLTCGAPRRHMCDTACTGHVVSGGDAPPLLPEPRPPPPERASAAALRPVGAAAAAVRSPSTDWAEASDALAAPTLRPAVAGRRAAAMRCAGGDTCARGQPVFTGSERARGPT